LFKNLFNAFIKKHFQHFLIIFFLFFSHYNINSKYEHLENNSHTCSSKFNMSTFTNILNTEVEGECRIRSISSIRLKFSKLIIFFILTLLTLGILALFVKWFVKLQRWLLYIPCSLSEASHLFIQNNDDACSIVPLNHQPEIPLYPYYFINRHMKYLFDQTKTAFRAAEYIFPMNFTQKDILEKYSSGITNKEQLFLHKTLYGKCLIEIPLPEIFPYMFKELCNPFFILQYISCAIWIFESFIMFAIILIAVSITLTFMNYVFYYFAKKRLKTLAEQQIPLKIFRNNWKEFQTIHSSELVPGDVFIIEDQTTIPCDCILISGDSLMNESMLTGESIPTPKFPLDPHNDLPFDYISCNRNILYEGTKVLQIKSSQNGYVLALALRTGFASTKGQMIRTILFPKPIEFGFNKQGIKYILSLAIICFALYFVTLAKMIELNMGIQLEILRFLDVITWVIPPALPIFMTFAMTLSIIRLKFKGIIGLNPHSILLAGKVDICCFDKTGTITDNGIGVNGVYEVENRGLKEVSSIKAEEKEIKLITKLMATCHSVYLINEVLIGDSLDISMLEYSSWKYQTNSNPEIKFQTVSSNKKLEVLKVFEFSSNLQRMCVFVKDVLMNKYYIFMKGSPEKVRLFCEPSSIPLDFNEVLEGKSLQGFRILGLAYKEISEKEKGNFLTAKREEIENSMNFLGFLVLENKLKKDSRVSLLRLNEAGLKIKLISGDNILTTIQTAKEAGILQENLDVLMCEMENSQISLKILKKNTNFSAEKGKSDLSVNPFINLNSSSASLAKKNKISVEMESLENQSPSKKKSIIKILAFSSTKELLVHLDSVMINFSHDYEFALSGPAFEFLDSSSQTDHQIASIFSTLLEKSKILARMRPEQKTLAVLKLQKSEHIVCMTGDGANDCGALKQADIGVSFSETDASFSAPFTSVNTSINCVEKVLLEGRATVVNSVEVFRYYMTVSFLKFFGIWLLVFSAANLNDFQWTYINYLNSIISLSMISLGAPLAKLSKEKPPDNLIGYENLFSIYGVMLIGALGEAFAYIMLRNEEWFDEPAVLINDTYRMSGPSNTTIFYAMNLFYNSSIVAFVITLPFKERLYKNYLLSVWLGISFIYNSLLVFWPEMQIEGMWLVQLEEGFKGKLYALLIGMAIGMIVYEEIVCKKIIRKFESKRRGKN